MEEKRKRNVLVMLRYAMKGANKGKEKKCPVSIYSGRVAQQLWPKPLESHVEYDVPFHLNESWRCRN